MRFKTKTIGEVAEVQTGPFGSQLHKEDYVEAGTPIVTVEHLGQRRFSMQNLPRVKDCDRDRLLKYTLKTGDLVFSRVGSVDRISFVTDDENGWMFSGRCLRLRVFGEIDALWLYYFFCLEQTKQFVRNIAVGATMPSINTKLLSEVPVSYPENIADQRKIASILSLIDDKIELNSTINHNLEQQAFALFDYLFPNISDGLCTIGDYITPKRGRNLLSKDAVPGTVPVVAGGLEPSTYHNIANTLAPVLTISASGANAGFVNLWHKPVWSSDSSFIDSSMTKDVYFWFVMLKKRQREIFDAQTGSAQPHIYPQHIAAMTIRSLDQALMSNFTSQVTPLFALIGANKDENDRLTSVRDALLPKLISGEIDVSEIEV